MKHTLFLLPILALLTSCSGGGESLVEISVTSSVRMTIPAAGYSCLARKTAVDTSTSPSSDVSAAYFTIPKMTFKLADPTRDTYISQIKVTFTPPGGSETSCVFGGDSLAALRLSWWQTTLKEAKIAANSAEADRATDCPMYCGGVNVDAGSFTSSGTIKVYGYTQDPNNDDDSTGFTTTTYFTFGSQ